MGLLDSLGDAFAEIAEIERQTIVTRVKAGLEADLDALAGAEAVYYLDLLEHRAVSDAVAERFDVTHQSPQILLIRDGACLYTEWGYDISAEEVAGVMAEGKAKE